VLNLLGDEAPAVRNAAYFGKTFETVQQLINQELILAGHDIAEGGLITTLLEMCFAVPEVGLTLNVSAMHDDLVTICFAENPGIVIQVTDEGNVASRLAKEGIAYHILGHVTVSGRKIALRHQQHMLTLDIDTLRDTWYKTSYLLDQKQRPQEFAALRYKNYKEQPLTYTFPSAFTGDYSIYGIDPRRRSRTGLRAAIIREKGVNGDREMAYALYLAGFDVKDIHMTDLVSGRENLSDVHLIVFVGGFSNSDVLGSAKGWAGAFLYNPKAKEALDNFYKRNDTLSLGVCNGCQLMMELGLLYPEWKEHPKMHHNKSGKFESAFLNVTIPENNSIMLKTMAGARLGVWIAHGEGRFILPENKTLFQVTAQYSYEAYPGTPGGSDYSTAALCSKDGRHLAIMPHIERSLFPWNWPYYPANRRNDKISPWIEAFVNARKWVQEKTR
jgi:phosphoribosylformylglycinamidine synthase